MKTWSYLIIVALFVAALFYKDRTLISDHPPAIHGTTLSGHEFDLSEFNGKVSLIYFWASWCPICGAMQSNIEALSKDHPLISFAMQSGDKAEVLRDLQEQSFDVEVLLDEEGAMAQRFGLRGVPAVFVLDKKGEIRFATTGYSSEIGLRFRVWLAGL